MKNNTTLYTCDKNGNNFEPLVSWNDTDENDERDVIRDYIYDGYDKVYGVAIYEITFPNGQPGYQAEVEHSEGNNIDFFLVKYQF